MLYHLLIITSIYLKINLSVSLILLKNSKITESEDLIENKLNILS